MTTPQPLYRIAWIAFLLLASLAVAGCGTPSGKSTSPVEPTLRGDPRLPLGDLHMMFKPSEWERLANRPYTGYAILRGYIETDGTISGQRVVEAYPDRSRDLLAIEFCDEIRIKPRTIGSRAKPTAEIYVVFYESSLNRTALIYGRQDNSVGTKGVIQQAFTKSY